MTVKSEDEFARLSEKARQDVQLKTVKLRSALPRDTQSLLRELEDQQVELELQNEELRRTRQQFEESNHVNAKLYELAPFSYFILDKKGIIKSANTAAGELLARERKLLVGKPLSVYVAPPDLEFFFEHLRNAFEHPTPRTGQWRMLQNGAIRYVQAQSVCMDETKTCLMTMTDMTRHRTAEEALRDSEQKYRTIVETAAEGIATHAPDGTITYINQRMADMLGYSPEELIGRSSLDFADNEEKQAVIEAREHLKEKGSFNTERKLRRKDGSILWTLVNVSPRRDDDGNFAGYLAMHTDITKRKRAEEALRESEEKFAKAFHANPAAMTITHLSDGMIVDANAACERLFGYSLNQMVGRTTLELGVYADPRQRQAVTERVQDGGSVRDYEILFVTKTGARIVTLVSVELVAIRGEPFILTTVIDITARKAAEEALRAKDMELQLVADMTPVVLTRISRDLHYVFVNRACCELFGLPREKIIGKSVLEIMGKDALATIRPYIERVLRGERIQYEVEIPYKEVGRRFMHVEYVPERDENGDAAGWIASIHDITARKRAEKALRDSEERFRLSMEATSDGLWDWNAETDEVYYSPSYYRILGYEPAAFAGTLAAWKERVHPDDLERTVQVNMDCVEGRSESFAVEYRMKAASGQWRWILGRGRCIMRDEKGRAVRLIGTHVDITERKQAEEQERKRLAKTELINRILGLFVQYDEEEMFDRVLATIQETLGSRHGVFGYISEPGHLMCPSLSKMLESCEIEGKCIHYPPEKWKGLWARALKEKRSIYANEAPPVPRGHVPIRNNLAVPIMFGSEAIGLFNVANKEAGYTEQDKETLEEIAGRVAPVLYAWIQRKEREDERRQAETVLKQANSELEMRVQDRTAQLRQAMQNTTKERQQLYNVLETLPAYVCLLTPGYRMLFANRIFREWFAYDPDRACYEFLFNRTEPCENCRTYDVLKTRAPQQWEWTGPNGRIYDIYDYPFKDTDGSTLILEMGMDITERKQAEEAVQQQSNQLRALAGQLSRAEQRERKRLSKILHDHIQQLIVAARMQLAWMKNEGTREQQFAVETTDSILNEALDASRSLAVELCPPILHDAGLVGGLSWLTARMREKNRFTVHLDADSSAEPAAEDTRLLLFECVRELLLNAVKYSGASEAQVTLKRANDHEIKLIISDQGKGFDVSALNDRRPDEMTFGLFSIRERLAHIGGLMEIESTPGQGSRFALTVPSPAQV